MKTMKVLCPKCGSDQFHSNQKGFSAGNALGGAVVTGGVGLLAGFIGSKKVTITCLACGNKFKAGEGRSNFNNVDNEVRNESSSEIFDPILAREVNRINSESGILQAVKYVQEKKGIGFNEAKEIVDAQLSSSSIPVGNSQSSLGGMIFLLGGIIVILIIIVKLGGC
jgi:predicted RNA-binding Zn-ribbon protein involved in translation (DUF1610 family)